MQLAGLTVLLTGGASGLGAACAARFASLGANVIIADLNAAAGAEQATRMGNSAISVVCDVCSPESVQAAIDVAVKRGGGLHAVIHCAGMLAASRVVSRHGVHDLALFRRVVETNLVGSFNVASLAAAAMQKNQPHDTGERGVIVLTSSIAAFEGQIGQAAYAASKGGVASLVLPLARELGSSGIRVVAIAPGVFETPMMAAAPAAVRDSLLAQIPFPARFGLPEEFAALAEQVVRNALLNGATIRLDGGLRMPAR